MTLTATVVALTATTPPAGAAAAAVAASAGKASAPLPGQVAATPDGDAYTVPSAADRTTGTAATLMAGDEALDGRVAYLRFTLPVLPVDASDVTASLVLHQVEPSKAGAVKLWSVSANWSATTLTATTAPALDALLSRAPAGVSGAATVLAVPAARLQVRGDIGLAVTAFLGAPTAIAFAAAEAADPTTRPALLISYTTGAGCPLSSILVPACGALAGSTANPLGAETTAVQAVQRQEAELGRTLRVVHVYHVAKDDWPTADEVALATDPAHPRLLFVNWKPENGHTWADVAKGASDALIDAEAAKLVARLGGRPFFFADHHEPEEEVRAAGTGYALADYAAMFRHVVQRLRADGVVGLVSVWDVMGYSGFGDKGYYPALYPGDDVVDWIGYDPYSTGGLSLTAFADSPGKSFPGFYSWATSAHPGKPLMLGEWGVGGASPSARAAVFDTLVAQARAMPALKAFVYFDHAPDATTNGQDYSYDSDAAVLAAVRGALGSAYLEP